MKVFFNNTLQGRTLVFREDRCTGCGDCLDVCPQKFLLPVGGAKRSVGWRTRVIPEPAGGVCAECNLCLPYRSGGMQREGAPPVLCPWGVCTMCDFCTEICHDKAIYTVPLLSVAEDAAPKPEPAGEEARGSPGAEVGEVPEHTAPRVH